MKITVAICTLNRAESLRRALDSLAAMQVPDDLDWELVVVNNGSTDRTDDVVDSFGGRLPVRRELEPWRGLSRARNRAIDAARGDYIIWTDDDVLVDSGWLAAYVDAFQHWPEASVFGGPVVPRYEPPVPNWIAECQALLTGTYAIRDFGDQIVSLSRSERRVPYGPSYAIRITEQRAFRYDPDLGARPGPGRVGEETDVIDRILLSGATGYWLPKARVQHCIGQDRQTVAYVGRWFKSLGETDAFRHPESRRAARLFGAPRWLWRQLVVGWILYGIHRLISPAPVWMAHLMSYTMAWGAIRYWRSVKG